MAEEEKPSPKNEQSRTPEDFIVKWPLYTPFAYEHFSPPERVSFHCSGDCGKETTWVRVADPIYQSVGGFFSVLYACGLCRSKNLLVTYREFETVMRPSPRARPLNSGVTNVRVVTKIQKIGQFPPLSVNIPKVLKKNLGEVAALLYKKSQVNRNEGYGLAAVTYIRRVVEDKTDELIEVVAQLAESHNLTSTVVEQIRTAKNERTTYDNKLKIAATVLPDSLVVDGVNPLGQLYNLVSVGVHDLTEEQCIAVADETKSVFEFTFTYLRAETKVRHDFVAKVKKWAGGQGLGQKEKSGIDSKKAE